MPSAASVSSGSRSACGAERWTVKTLQDRPRLLPVRRVTLAYLVSRPAPASLPTTRLPFERHVFRVTAAVSLVRPEADGDLHLVLSDGKRTMIAESPSGGCTKKERPLVGGKSRRRGLASVSARRRPSLESPSSTSSTVRLASLRTPSRCTRSSPLPARHHRRLRRRRQRLCPPQPLRRRPRLRRLPRPLQRRTARRVTQMSASRRRCPTSTARTFRIATSA
jgi:hypothetical protein